jgi:hypothetical protein
VKRVVALLTSGTSAVSSLLSCLPVILGFHRRDECARGGEFPRKEIHPLLVFATLVTQQKCRVKCFRLRRVLEHMTKTVFFGTGLGRCGNE